jgi:hypothetical protein
VDISYDVTVTTTAGVSNPLPFVVLRSHTCGTLRNRGFQSASARQALQLVAESPTGFAVLALNHTALPGTRSAAATAVTLQNKRKARYVVSIQTTAVGLSGAPSHFLLAPGGTRIFHLNLKRGEDMTISADAYFNPVPATEQDTQLLAVLGMELIWRACFHSDLPHVAAEFAVAAAAPRDPLRLQALGAAAARGDLYEIRECLEGIASDPAIHARFAEIGIEPPDLLVEATNPKTLFAVLEDLRAQVMAAMSHPNDQVILRAR